MKLIKVIKVKNIGGVILGVVMLLGIGMVSSATTQAQYPNQSQSQRERERQAEIQRQAELQRNRQQNNGRWDDRNRPGRRGRDGNGYGNYGGSYELRQTALNAGYNEGMKEGRKDRSHNDRFSFTDEGAYRSATKDYNSRLVDRSAYQQYFRAAFENGYSDGYYGY